MTVTVMIVTMLPSREEMMAAALTKAATIASKSPAAVEGMKASLAYSREHRVQEGLERAALHCMARGTAGGGQAE
jgi:enoyl-CoA hydratase/carnithine racemase